MEPHLSPLFDAPQPLTCRLCVGKITIQADYVGLHWESTGALQESTQRG